MNPDLLNTIMVNALPLTVAIAVAMYHFIIQFLPANRHAQLSSLMSNLSGIAQISVRGVEQFMGSEAGPVKKAAASNDIAAILNATGIRGVPTELIDNAIEAAVYAMNVFKPIAVANLTAPSPASVAIASPVATPETVQNTVAS